jgi:peptidase M23
MIGSFSKPLNYIIVTVMVLTIFICTFFMPEMHIDFENRIIGEDIEISEYGFAWPIPGYNKITSYFGKRNSPTQGASSYHKGIDIGAPEGTVLIAVADGKITYTGFLGGGGYTITLSIEDMKITYCHVSPTFIVEVGQKVERGEIIGYVGPKYVYGVKGNTYTDSTGKPTNGATTGCHLHLGIRVNGEYTNPLNYY